MSPSKSAGHPRHLHVRSRPIPDPFGPADDRRRGRSPARHGGARGPGRDQRRRPVRRRRGPRPPARERVHGCARPDARPAARRPPGDRRGRHRRRGRARRIRGLRDAAAAFARAAARDGVLATTLTDVAGVDAAAAGQAVVEGVLLARYRYRAFVDRPAEAPLTSLTLVADRRPRARRSGPARSGAACWPRRSRSPATWRTRRRPTSPRPRMAEVAGSSGPEAGLEVEVFDNDALVELGCGGLLGVNPGSDEPARMIKLTYAPRKRDGRRPGRGPPRARRQGDHVRLRRHQPQAVRRDARAMKNDMSGAAAVLGSMLDAAGARLPDRGHRLPHVHRQHAVGHGDAARRRAHDPRRDDRRGRQHRRRGPARHGRRARARHRGPRPDAIVDDRHAHRARRCARSGRRSPPCSATTRTSSTSSRRPATHRRAGLGAAAGQAATAQARLGDRRHQEPRRRERRHDHGRAVPRGVRRRRPVRPPRHLRSDDDRHRRRLAIDRRHGLRHAAAQRPRAGVPAPPKG